MEESPPIPDPITIATFFLFIFCLSRLASSIAWIPAAIPYWINLSNFFAIFFLVKSFKLKFSIIPAIFVYLKNLIQVSPSYIQYSS